MTRAVVPRLAGENCPGSDATGERWPTLALPPASDASARRQERVAGWLDASAAVSAEDEAQAPLFLLVTPLGMGVRGELAGRLRELGVEVEGRLPVACHGEVAAAIYARDGGETAARVSLGYDEAWRVLAGDRGAEGELWWLSPREAHARLIEAKGELRAGLCPDVRFWLDLGPLRRPASLHAFHVPDAGQLAPEIARIEGALGGLPPVGQTAPGRPATRWSSMCPERRALVSR